MPKDKDLDLNSSADLPQGSSTMGASGGALGDASMADLQRGYSDGTYTAPVQDDGTGPITFDDDSSKIKGFLTRPEGWER